MNAVSYFCSDKIALRAMRAQPVSRGAVARAATRWCASWRPRPASRCPGCTSARPCSPTRSPPGATRSNAAVCVTEGILSILDSARAARRDRPRAVPRLQPRHPDLQRGRRAGRHHHDAGALAWFIPLGGRDDEDGPQPGRLLLMLILGPLAADRHPAGDQPQPRVPGRRVRRRADRRPARAGQRAAEDPLRYAARCRCRPTASSPAPRT